MSVNDFTLTKEYLHQLFKYKDGELFWIKQTGKRSKIGKKAGSFNKNGYKAICLNNKKYYNHRLIFMMFNGYLPKYIDHIDGNLKNNSINNLRQATDSQNNYNQKMPKTNTSGIKSVSWDKNRNKWHVQVISEKKVVFQKRFDDIELAEFVAIEARNKYHGKFARHT